MIIADCLLVRKRLALQQAHADAKRRYSSRVISLVCPDLLQAHVVVCDIDSGNVLRIIHMDLLRGAARGNQ